MLNFKHYKSILCLDGDLPGADFFETDLPIVAADGAVNRLMQLNIRPSMVIGDLDSALPEHLKIIPSHYHYDQNFCDFEKALQYLERNQLLPAVIVGLSGGYLDHILNNVNHFLQSGCVFFAPPLYGFTVNEGSNKRLILPLNTKISLLGIPSAMVMTTGLKWNLYGDALAFPGKNSCFNRTLEREIKIQVHSGAILVLIYDEIASQNP